MNEIHLPLLAAEDEESDALILRFACQRAGVANPLIVVRDGQEAVDYLAGKAPYNDRSTYPLPALLLLDLKMPRMSGFEVLAWLAKRPRFKRIPTFVLSSSSDEDDVERARHMGAWDYFVKPFELDDLVKIIHGLRNRWLNGVDKAA